MLRNKTPQSKALARQKVSFRSFNFRNEGKQLTSIQPQKIQICSRGKIEFKNPNNPRQNKIKRRVQNFKKFGKKVAAATDIKRHALGAYHPLGLVLPLWLTQMWPNTIKTHESNLAGI